ncbi:MAG: hypothetical protein N3D73_00175 [Candidatus Diapherotrites archaeon]|nr:hypothetical protein [Candidatus Diapherotrites archaeon]
MSKRALVVILNNCEDNEDFLEKVSQDSKEIFLLAVIDVDSLKGICGFVASQISQANRLLEECKSKLSKRGVCVKESLEWGETVNKIIATAKKSEIKRVYLKSQNNQYFQDLIKKLSKEGFEVIVI